MIILRKPLNRRTLLRGAGTMMALPLLEAMLPSAKAAARFLIQAAFGPDQDSSADGDDIPENVEELMAMGFDAWIEDQFNRPIGYLQPYVNWALAKSRS